MLQSHKSQAQWPPGSTDTFSSLCKVLPVSLVKTTFSPSGSILHGTYEGQLLDPSSSGTSLVLAASRTETPHPCPEATRLALTCSVTEGKPPTQPFISCPAPPGLGSWTQWAIKAGCWLTVLLHPRAGNPRHSCWQGPPSPQACPHLPSPAPPRTGPPRPPPRLPPTLPPG